MDETGWNERYSGKEFVWSLQPNATVKQYLEDADPGSALDLGAGEGRNAVWLATEGWDVTAVDFSSAGLAKAERLAGEFGVAIKLLNHDLTTFEMGIRAWDLVLLSYIQLPNPERLEILSRAAEAVAPDGLFFVIAHDRANVTKGWGGPPNEAECYTVDETRSVLNGGFDVQIADVLERRVETDSGTKIALDTLVVAHRLAS